MTDMSVDALKDNLSDAQRSYLFELIIPNPVGGGNEETLRLRLMSTSLPGRSFGGILIPFKQSAGVKYPGKLTYDHTWDCVFVEGEDEKTFDALYAWFQSVIHDRTNMGTNDVVIKTDGILRMLGRDGAVTRKVKMIGLYPESLGDTPISQDDEGELRYTMTWSYDRWEDI